MIPVTDKTAGFALVNSHAESLADFCSAQTGLTCSARIYFHEQPTGAFSLVGQHVYESRPSGVINRLRQHAFSESLDIQIFDCDQAVPVDNLSRFFVVKIAPLSANVIVKPLKQQHCFAPTATAFLSPFYATLQASQFRFRVSKVARVLNRGTIAQGSKRSQPNVNSGCVRIEWKLLAFTLNYKQSKPAPSLTLNGQSLDRPFERAMQFDSDVTDLRQAQSVSTKRISNLSEGKTVVTTNRSESRIASLLSGLYSTKESAEGQVNTFQYVFQYRDIKSRYIFSALLYLNKLAVLIEPRNSLTLDLPRISAFLQSGIEQFGTHGELVVQRSLLAFRRIDFVAKSLNQTTLILSNRFSFAERIV